MLLFSNSPDQEKQSLKELGYTGTLNDMQYKWLGDQGYTSGALGDRMLSYFTNELGQPSWRQWALNEFETTSVKDWLLELGTWNDNKIWRDSADWNDGV